MKRQILSVVVTLSAVVILSVAGFAAISGMIRAEVPFDFTVGSKKLPAGKYTVDARNSNGTLVIRNKETRKVVASISRSFEVDADNRPQLIFHRYGNQYFLTKVVGYASGNELPKSKAEREAAKAIRDNLAKNDAGPEIVTISADLGQ
jgi:hypothetical protein